eukprot:375231_1
METSNSKLNNLVNKATKGEKDTPTKSEISQSRKQVDVQALRKTKLQSKQKEQDDSGLNEEERKVWLSGAKEERKVWLNHILRYLGTKGAPLAKYIPTMMTCAQKIEIKNRDYIWYDRDFQGCLRANGVVAMVDGLSNKRMDWNLDWNSAREVPNDLILGEQFEDYGSVNHAIGGSNNYDQVFIMGTVIAILLLVNVVCFMIKCCKARGGIGDRRKLIDNRCIESDVCDGV